VIIFRVVAVLAGLFFVVAVVLMASAPWVLLQPDQQTRTELNRWFLTVAGSVDAIAAGVLLALALQPRRTLLIVEHAVAAIVAGALILPFQAFLRCHPRDRRGPADRLPVLAGWAIVPVVVGRRVAWIAHPGGVGGHRSCCDGSHGIPAADRRDRPGSSWGLVVGLCRARDRACAGRSARR
jgi:hypothetical protein